MATSATPIVSGGFLVVAPGGFMSPRLLLVPAGTRLPAGVYAVAEASAPGSGRRGAVRCGVAAGSEVVVLAPAGARVPAAVHGVLALPAAAPGSGRRGATRSVVAGAGSEAGNTHDDGSQDPVFHRLLQVHAEIAAGLLSEFAPPAAPRDERYDELKLVVTDLLGRAGEGDKLGGAITLVRAAYAIVRLAHWCYANPALPPLPLEQTFVSLCVGTDPKVPVVPESLGELTPLLGLDLLAPEMGEEDAVLIKGVMTAINVATSASRTARYVYWCGGHA